jgi:hypothetical protein
MEVGMGTDRHLAEIALERSGAGAAQKLAMPGDHLPVLSFAVSVENGASVKNGAKQRRCNDSATWGMDR